MEHFVQFVLIGGLALVVGLWITASFASGTAPWLAGVTVALLGCGALVVGIRSPLET